VAGGALFAFVDLQARGYFGGGRIGARGLRGTRDQTERDDKRYCMVWQTVQSCLMIFPSLVLWLSS
jgi:hypothetical protein